MPQLIPWVFIGGWVLGGGVVFKARDSVVICMVLRCNCSISNNVVRLLVQIREEVIIVEELTERH